MASLFNTKISNTYVGLIKTIDNAVLSSSLRELTDGSGNASGIHISNAGDLKVTNILEFGSLKDTGENITISKFVDEADGIANNDNDTSIPTSAAVVDYVAARITLEDLDFRGDDSTVLGDVDLDSEAFIILGTANEIETTVTSAGGNTLQIGLPDNVTIGGNLQVNGLLKGNNNIVIKDTSDRTMAAFYGGGKAELYFNDSKKFETTSDGATVTGGLTATGGSVFTGATFSSDVDFADSAKARFGDGNDLQIFHSAGTSIIDNTIGDLIIKVSQDDGDLIFQSDNGSGAISTYFRVDGGVKQTIFEENLRINDNKYALFGNSNDLEIRHDGTNSEIVNNTGNLTISNRTDDGDIIFQSDDGSGGTTEYFKLDGTNVRTLVSKNFNLKDSVLLQLGDSQDLRLYHSGSHSFIENISVGNLYFRQYVDDSDIIFENDNGSGGLTEYFRIDGGAVKTIASKNFAFLDNVKIELGDSGDLEIYHDGSNSLIRNTNGNLFIENQADDGNIIFKSDDGSGGNAEYFRVDGQYEVNRFLKNARFNDSVKANFGTADDLAIYHDGSNSYIQDSGTGNLWIQGSTQVNIGGANGEIGVQYVEDAGVGLRHNNIQKLSTSSTGVTITGVAVADGLDMGDDEKIRLGDSQDLQIYHDGSNSYISEVGTGDLYIKAGNDLIIQEGNGLSAIHINDSDSVQLYFAGNEKFVTTSTGVSVTGGIVASGDATITGGDITLGTNAIASNINAQGDVLNIVVDSNNDTGGTPNIQFKTASTTQLTLNSTTATFAGSVVIAQDLTVNGTTTTVNTSTLAVEDPLISMAKDNSANSVDIGFYGRYNDSSNRYLGLFADASDSNTFKLFKGTTTEPTTTVDTTATGYSLADLDMNNLSVEGTSALNGDITVGDTSSAFIGMARSGANYIAATNASGQLVFRTGGSTAALTLDNSQNATFAGDVALGDDKDLIFGASTDYKIYHNSTTNVNHISSLIDRQLSINANQVFITNQANTENMARFIADAEVKLYYDNVQKFQTTSTGIEVSGTSSTFAGNVAINGNATLGDGTGDDHTINGQVTHLTADALGYKLHRTGGGTSMLISATGDAELEFGTDNGSGTNTTHWTIGKDGTDNSFRISNSASLGTSDALTIDSSENSTFSGSVTTGTGLKLYTDGSGNGIIYNLGQDKDLYFVVDDGGTGVNALVIDGSENGNATFAGGIGIGGATVANSYGIEITATSGNIIRSTRGTSVFAAYQSNNSDVYLGTTSANTFKIITNDATAVTIGSDKNATFAGTITVNGNATNLIDGIQTNTSNTAVSAKTGTLRLNYAGGSAAGDYGASLLFTQRWHSGTASDIVMGQIAGVKVEGDGNFGGGLAFFTGNNTGNDLVERMRIDNDGFVGIGATVPEKILHIKGATGDATPQVLVQNSSTGDASMLFNVSGQSYIMGIDYDDSKKFKIASSGALGTTDLITVLSSGALGVGTINPAEKVEINGSMKIGNMKFQNATGGRIGFNRNTADGVIYDNSYSAFQINGATASDDYLDFQAYSSAGAYTGGFTLSNTGDFGIGLNNQGDYYGDKFVVKAPDENGITIVGTAANQKQYICFADGTSGAAAYTGYIAYDHNDDSMSFANNGGNNRMTINSNGNVGIGGAANNKLELQDTATGTGSTFLKVARGADSSAVSRIAGIKLGNTASNDGSNWIVQANSSAGYFDNATLEFIHNAAGTATTRMSLLNDGRLYPTGGVFLGSFNNSNLLDDYEEGTWTPVLKFGGSATGITYSQQAGVYTKVGRVVTFSLRITLTSKGSLSGEAQITGLPFSAANITGNFGSCMLAFANAITIEDATMFTIDSNGSIINFRYNVSQNYANYSPSQFNNNSDVILTGTYQAA